MLRKRFDVSLPGATVAAFKRRLDAIAQSHGGEVRVRINDEGQLIARHWVSGIYATGSSVMRAHARDTHAGLQVRGTVAPSGPDLVIVAVLLLATLTVTGMGVAHSDGLILAVALVPLGLGVAFAAHLPRSVQDGYRILSQTLFDDPV